MPNLSQPNGDFDELQRNAGAEPLGRAGPETAAVIRPNRPQKNAGNPVSAPNYSVQVFVGNGSASNFTKPTWPLHHALIFLTGIKPEMAMKMKMIADLFNGISINMFNTRHYCRAAHFVQSAYYHKQQKTPDLPHILLLLKNAREQLKKLSTEYYPGQRLLIEVNLLLGVELASSDPINTKRYITEADYIRNQLKQNGLEKIVLVDALARAYNEMGIRLDKLGEADLALKCKQQSLEAFQAVHQGKLHRNVAALLTNVGILLENFGKHQEAIKFQRESLEMFKHLVPEPNERTAGAMNNLGLTLWQMGQLDEGLQYLRMALEMRRAVYDNKNHEKLAASLSNLGWSLANSGRPQEGIFLLRKGLTMQCQLSMLDSVYLARSCKDLGSALIHLGPDLFNEARDLLREAVFMYRRLKQANEIGSIDFARALNSLGILEEKFENCEEGLRLKQESRYILNQQLGDKDIPSIALSLASVGEALAHIHHQRAEGVKMLRDALAMYERMGIPSIDSLLCVSALLPYLDADEAKRLATAKVTLFKHVLKYLSPYYHTQVSSAFEAVLPDLPLLLNCSSDDPIPSDANSSTIEALWQQVRDYNALQPQPNILFQQNDGDDLDQTSSIHTLIEAYDPAQRTVFAKAPSVSSERAATAASSGSLASTVGMFRLRGSQETPIESHPNATNDVRASTA